MRTSHWTLLLMLCIQFLSGLDGLLTIKLLQLGCVEANPVMIPLVARGAAHFLGGKLLLTSACLWPIWPVRHRTFFRTNWMRANHVLGGLILAYLSLLGYQFYLLLY